MDEITVVPETGLSVARDLSEDTLAYLDARRSRKTAKDYGKGWRYFATWCERHGVEALPASPVTVANFVSALGREAGLKPSTVRTYLAAVNDAHRMAGFEDVPGRHYGVREVLKGLSRREGTEPDKAPPLLRKELLRAVAGITEGDLKATRDRALLLVGWRGALRRSEIGRLTVEDLLFTEEGVRVRIARSKTDQEGRGQFVGIPFGESPESCPVGALQRWLEVAQITTGAVFRGIHRSGKIRETGLSGEAVNQILKARAGSDFSGHSLRRGVLVQGKHDGMDDSTLMRLSRHRSVAVFRGYLDEAELWANNPGSFGL